MPCDIPNGAPALPDRLTEKELARHWRVTPRTLQRWREASEGPHWLKIGGRILYPRSGVLAFEERHSKGGEAQ
ncbi:DNA-binding protein [Vannielia litorea]|nr:DNA-binding protein [Vannielia litorea]